MITIQNSNDGTSDTKTFQYIFLQKESNSGQDYK